MFDHDYHEYHYPMTALESPAIPHVEKVTYDKQGRKRVPIQWARRLFHMSSSIIPLTVLYFGISSREALLYTWPIVLFLLLPEIVRLRVPAFNRFFCRTFGPLMRPHEAHSIHTAAEFSLAVYFGVAMYGIETMLASFLCLSFGDPLAAIVGLKFGRIQVLGKTIEGSLACFAVSFGICAAFFPGKPLIALLGATGATLGELIPVKGINDNIRIPFLAGAMITLGKMLV